MDPLIDGWNAIAHARDRQTDRHQREMGWRGRERMRGEKENVFIAPRTHCFQDGIYVATGVWSSGKNTQKFLFSFSLRFPLLLI